MTPWGDNVTSDGLRIYQDILTNVEYYFVPLIILVGFVGNSLSFVVFVGTHLRRHSCNIYLASLSVGNNAFLLGVLISWSNNVGFGVFSVDGWCQVVVYLTYVSSFLSVWYVVSFTVERYIVVCFPLKRDELCSTRTAKIVVGTLAVFSLLAYSFAPFTHGVISLHDLGPSLCAPFDQDSRVLFTINSMDTLITLVIPTVIIIGCNIRIAYIVCSFYKTYRHQMNWNPIKKWDFSHNRCSSDGHSNLSNTRLACVYTTAGGSLAQDKTSGPVSLSRTSHMRASRMLLIVSTVFLFCNMPRHALRTYHYIMTLINGDYQPPPTFLLCQELFQILYYVNFAVNFFLYSLSGRSFRVGLRRLKVKIRRKLENASCCQHRRCQKAPSPKDSPKYISPGKRCGSIA